MADSDSSLGLLNEDEISWLHNSFLDFNSFPGAKALTDAELVDLRSCLQNMNDVFKNDVSFNEFVKPCFTVESGIRAYTDKRTRVLVWEAENKLINETDQVKAAAEPIEVPENIFPLFTSRSTEVLNTSHPVDNGMFTCDFNYTLHKSISESCLHDISISYGLVPEATFKSEQVSIRPKRSLSSIIAEFNKLKKRIGGNPEEVSSSEEDNKESTYTVDNESGENMGDAIVLESQAYTSKGPLKALNPFPKMFKQICSSVTNKFGSTKAMRPGSSLETPNTSFNLDTPIAVSTPTRRSQNQDEINTTFTRSLSEGQISLTKERTGPETPARAPSKPTLINLPSRLKTLQNSAAVPLKKNTGLKRPSSAPSESQNRPLTTSKQISVSSRHSVLPSSSKPIGTSAKPRPSVLKPSNMALPSASVLKSRLKSKTSLNKENINKN